jgi:hypothetical protein
MSKKTLIIVGIVLAIGTVVAIMVGLLPFWLIAVLATVMWLRRGYGRAKDVIKPLVDKGVPATATVVKKLRAISPRRTYVTYAFETASGKFEGRTVGFNQDLNHLAVGDSIDILHLPDQPNVNAPAWVVAQMRQAREDLAVKAVHGATSQ